jgi:TonB family protein
MPQSQDQQGTGLSQAGTKSMVTSDPCASLRESLSAEASARPDKPGKSQTGVKVSISPKTDTRLALGYSLRLAATVTGTTNTTVEWAVAGPGCSGPACGSIEGDVYFAPTAVPNAPLVRVTATSKADSRASDSITVCLVQPGRQWNLSSAAETLQAGAMASTMETAQNSSATDRSGNVVILTHTLGVDFGPYLQRLVHDVKQHWYAIIPRAAMPPQLKRGKVVIEFTILKNGQIAGVHYVSSSGDVALDRAAYEGISTSNPFSPLPQEFTGPYLGLRMAFVYNPDKSH